MKSGKAKQWHLIVTCEHGGPKIPRFLQKTFQGKDQILLTHRGYDIGALSIAKVLHRQFSSLLFFQTISRLVIDCNRSLHHPNVFSSYTCSLDDLSKDYLQETIYQPYRSGVEDAIRQWVDQGEFVLHLSIHSFTPILNGERRNAEIGFLYDPQRKSEVSMVKFMQHSLKKRAPYWRCRRNYPYRGTADGFTTYLRKQFTQSCYAGIEIELNQGLWKRHSKATIESSIVAMVRDLFAENYSPA